MKKDTILFILSEIEKELQKADIKRQLYLIDRRNVNLKKLEDMKKLTDESLMPWGKYKGYSMENVPASYLIWLYENRKCDEQVKNYIMKKLINYVQNTWNYSKS